IAGSSLRQDLAVCIIATIWPPELLPRTFLANVEDKERGCVSADLLLPVRRCLRDYARASNAASLSNQNRLWIQKSGPCCAQMEFWRRTGDVCPPHLWTPHHRICDGQSPNTPSPIPEALRELLPSSRSMSVLNQDGILARHRLSGSRDSGPRTPRVRLRYCWTSWRL